MGNLIPRVPGLFGQRVSVRRDFDRVECCFSLIACITKISINLLVVYRESVNLIGYLTHRLSADSLQLWIANENQLFWTCDACFTPQCTSPRQCLKPLNCWCKHNKTFFPKRYFTFLCNETTSKFILKQLDYSPSLAARRKLGLVI